MRQRARVQGLALSGILLLGHVAMASSVAPYTYRPGKHRLTEGTSTGSKEGW